MKKYDKLKGDECRTILLACYLMLRDNRLTLVRELIMDFVEGRIDEIETEDDLEGVF